MRTLEGTIAAQSTRERELEGRILELEASLAGRSSELRGAQQSHAVLHQQKLAVDEELSRTRAKAQSDAESFASEQSALRARMESERVSLTEQARETSLRLQNEMDAIRAELTRKLLSEQESVSRLQDELRMSRLEGERVSELRSRERAEAEAASMRAAEISRASLSQMESKMAAAQSASALDLERARKDLMNERAITQEIVTEAKQEAATAMAQTLEAREDALRWQRALATSSSPSIEYHSRSPKGLD